MIDLATGDIDRIDNLRNSSDHVYLTCRDRDNGCMYEHGPDRPDDYGLEFLLDHPYCVDCGCPLVIVPRSEYDGPEDKYHDLDRKGSPVLI